MAIDFERASLCIVNQEDRPEDCLNAEVHPGLRIASYAERGLARSRNRLLEHARGDVCIVADDDQVFLPEAWSIVERAHAARDDVAVISFQYEIEERRKAKRYHPVPRPHTLRTLHSVASIEITFKRDRLPTSVRFDERFGLGTPYPRGAENIFLNDLHRAGVPMTYEPAVICRHLGTPTGRRRGCEDPRGDGRVIGVVARRLHPLAWPLFALRDCAARKKQGLSWAGTTTYAWSALISGGIDSWPSSGRASDDGWTPFRLRSFSVGLRSSAPPPFRGWRC